MKKYLVLGFVLLALVAVPVFAQSTITIEQIIQALTANPTLLQQLRNLLLGNNLVSDNPDCYTFTRDLTVGSTGEDVRALQTFLASKGFFTGTVFTSYFGNLTKTALANYQASVGISPADGYFGSLTRAKVNSIYGCVATPPHAITCAEADLNGDGVVDADDTTFIQSYLGCNLSLGGNCAKANVNGDGIVNNFDLLAVRGKFGCDVSATLHIVSARYDGTKGITIISGEKLGQVNKVSFDGRSFSAGDGAVFIINDNQINFITPADYYPPDCNHEGCMPITKPGSYPVYVVSPTGTSNTVYVTVGIITQPLITSVAGKAAGNGEIDAGGTVIIQGTNLLGSKDTAYGTTVYIGETTCTITQASNDLILCMSSSALQVGATYNLYINTVLPGGDKGGSNIVKVKVISSVAQPSITVLSPNGGESYKVGDTVNVRWTTNLTGNLTVWLSDVSKAKGCDVGTVVASSGQYSLKLDKGSYYNCSQSPEAGRYKITLAPVGPGPSPEDSSNSYFTISSTPPPPASPKATNIVPTTNRTDGINITWTKPTGATKSAVYRCVPSGTFANCIIRGNHVEISTSGGITSASFLDTGIAIDSPFYYAIDSYNPNAGGNGWSDLAVSATAGVRVGTTAPPAPLVVTNTWQQFDTCSGGERTSWYTDKGTGKTVNQCVSKSNFHTGTKVVSHAWLQYDNCGTGTKTSWYTEPGANQMLYQCVATGILANSGEYIANVYVRYDDCLAGDTKTSWFMDTGTNHMIYECLTKATYSGATSQAVGSSQLANVWQGLLKFFGR